MRLVLFERAHVPLYHSWLQRKDIQVACSTEPCSLDEEYAYWEQIAHYVRLIEADDGQLIGDISVFEGFDDDDDLPAGEINLMIAEEAYRRKGYAKAAIAQAIIDNNHLSTFIAKIDVSNEASICLFESVGFVQGKGVDCFGNVTLVKRTA